MAFYRLKYQGTTIDSLLDEVNTNAANWNATTSSVSTIASDVTALESTVQSLAALVSNYTTESWTFTLANDTVVTKYVVLDGNS